MVGTLVASVDDAVSVRVSELICVLQFCLLLLPFVFVFVMGSNHRPVPVKLVLGVDF